MKRFAPLVAFALLALLLALPLLKGKNPDAAPSPLIGRHAPDAGLPKDAFDHGPALVNFFASWCVPCAAEQPQILKIGKAEGIAVFGVDYKDGQRAMQDFFAAHGNPYSALGIDYTGRIAIDWGVTGVPETFVVDGNGVVRLRIVGAVTDEIYKKEIRPLLERLKGK
jgi:cytochrome c biogenesis protein CcmG/thiol:disulfide interchange protein DsbE